MKTKDTMLDYDGEEVGIILREFPSETVSDALVDRLLKAQADNSLTKIREVVEEVENPYPMATPFEYFTGPKGHGRDGFEKARQAILKAIKED